MVSLYLQVGNPGRERGGHGILHCLKTINPYISKPPVSKHTQQHDLYLYVEV